MNAKERTTFLYHAMAEMLEYINPKGAVMVNMQDAYGAMITFDVDESLVRKVFELIVDQKFQLTEGEDSFIISKDYEEIGASVVLSKYKTNNKMNLSITL